MTEIPSPSDLFGVPFVIRKQDAEQLVGALGELWSSQTGRAAGPLNEDLDYLFANLFNPRTSGARVRQFLEELPDAPAVRSRFLNPPLIVRAGASVIVTPEGRAIYELLLHIVEESDDDPLGIDPIDTLSLLNVVYEGYRAVSTRRLLGSVELLFGDAEGLRVPSIALLLLLLINGSSCPKTAIRRPENQDERNRLDRSIARAITAFADNVRSGVRDPSHYSLYSGYAVTEARRRLGNALGPSPDEIYVASEHRDTVIERVARELRRSRRSPETRNVMVAFDSLVSAYRAERPTLASLGVTHENRADTARLRAQLERALGDP